MTNFDINIFGKKFEKAINKVFTNISTFYDEQTHSKYGITTKQYPNIDVKNLTFAEAAFLHYRDNWSTQFYEKISSDELAAKIFETAIEIGTETAHILLQRALRSTGNFVKEDGHLGKITLAAVNNANHRELLAAFRSEIAGHYRQTYSDTDAFLKLAYA